MELHNVLDFPILSLSIFLPLAGALVIWLLVRGDNAVRWASLAVSIATFIVTLPQIGRASCRERG
mgnify:CR=1 FL=1